MNAMAKICAILALLIFSSVALADGEKSETAVTCDFSITLAEMWEYRGWDKSHIEKVRVAIEAAQIKFTIIEVVNYQFWSGNDEANLKAFVRDQRFGRSVDSIVVTVDDEVRYTLFLCQCGLTAVYRGLRPQPPQVVTPTITPRATRPPVRRTPRPPVVRDQGIIFGPIPDAHCPEPPVRQRQRSC